MITTKFKTGDKLRSGDVIHPEEGEPIRVGRVEPAGWEFQVYDTRGNLLGSVTPDDTIEIEITVRG